MKLPEKLLFLDIDGVLNSEDWLYRSGMTFSSNRLDHLDPQACRLLNDVLEQTSCGLILSSSWRYICTPSQVQTLLHKRGCAKAQFYGHTPRLGDQDDRRGKEIAKWLEVTQWQGTFAIVDDGDDMGELRPRLVRTKWSTGLTRTEAQALVSLLNQ